MLRAASGAKLRCVEVETSQVYAPALRSDGMILGWRRYPHGEVAILEHVEGERYCTAGVTSAGCTPSIRGEGLPIASSSSGFVIRVFDAPSQCSALFLYGVNGRHQSPWGTSTSFACVAPPTQRCAPQNTAGGQTACDGTFAFDFLAFVATHPSALGAPFAAGGVVQAQGWMRDPQNSRIGRLSDALEFTLR